MWRISKRIFLASFTVLTALVSQGANATLITFDDLAPKNCFCPLTNEYASQGLLINDGYLAVGGPAVVSPPNYLVGSHNFALYFLAPFPTIVSMYVSARAEDSITLTAYDVSGLFETIRTKGWAGPHNNTPYSPRQFVSFSDSDGISGILISGFYGLRVDAEIDDLYFASASAVNAPPSLALLGIGLLAGISWMRPTKKRSIHGRIPTT